MRVTRVVFNKESDSKALAVCCVIIDDCLKLTNIKLFHNRESGFYLVLPSKQDVYQDIDTLNPTLSVQYPQFRGIEGKPYEEYFYPLSAKFYKDMLNSVVAGYKVYKAKGKLSFRLE